MAGGNNATTLHEYLLATYRNWCWHQRLELLG